MVRIWIESSRRVDRTAGIGSKKLIKRWFESNLNQNLAWGRLDGVSLQESEWTGKWKKGGKILKLEHLLFLLFTSILSLSCNALVFTQWNLQARNLFLNKFFDWSKSWLVLEKWWHKYKLIFISPCQTRTLQNVRAVL